MIVQVEIFIGSADEAWLPSLGKVDEQDIELGPTCIKAMNSSYQTIRKYDMWF